MEGGRHTVKKEVGKGSGAIGYDWESDDVVFERLRKTSSSVTVVDAIAAAAVVAGCRLFLCVCVYVHAPVMANISFFFSSPFF